MGKRVVYAYGLGLAGVAQRGPYARRNRARRIGPERTCRAHRSNPPAHPHSSQADGTAAAGEDRNQPDDNPTRSSGERSEATTQGAAREVQTPVSMTAAARARAARTIQGPRRARAARRMAADRTTTRDPAVATIRGPAPATPETTDTDLIALQPSTALRSPPEGATC